MKFVARVFVLCSFFSLTSCNGWLSINPEAEASEERMFNTAEGFRSVLNGVYKSMGTGNLHGGALAFGLVDCISQQYDLTTGATSGKAFIAAGEFKYKNLDLNPQIDAIWSAAFGVIANANNLIQNAEKASPDLFSEGQTELDMILGEAYACRALMHFDLLRLFAPAPVNDDGGTYVPYLEKYPNILANSITVPVFLSKVIADLERARELVAAFDTSALGQTMIATGKARFYNEFNGEMEGGAQDAVVNDFFKGRGYRLNYYSITALLARVSQYAGDGQAAFQYADQVLKFEVSGKGPTYNLFGNDDFDGIQQNFWEIKEDVRVVSNLIFAVYNENAYESLDLKRMFAKNVEMEPNWLVVNIDKQKMFYTRENVDESLNDYRAKCLLLSVGGGVYTISGKWYGSDYDENVRDRNVTILPVIRATEMRYIKAECYARNNDFLNAKEILQEIRGNRGCTEELRVSTWQEFEEELIRDARREWISEGQLFYLYKRLNAKVDRGQGIVRPFNRSEYLLPKPTNQIL